MFFEKLLPLEVDNNYAGPTICLYFHMIMTFILTLRSLVHIFKSDGGAMSIATIPLLEYNADCSNTIISIFAIWGISQLLLCVFHIIVLLRYKKLIPLMLLTTILDYTLRLITINYKPIVLSGTAPGGLYGSLVLILLNSWFFFLSLRDSSKNNAEKIK